MKVNDVFESTTSGAVATVSSPIGGMKTRGQGVYPNKKSGNLLKGKTTKSKYPNSLSEDELAEQDLILVPGQGTKVKPGFIPHDKDRTDHEVEMARSDLFQCAKNAKTVYDLIKDVSEDDGIEGWVQEKIIKANDYLNTIREYLEHKTYMQETAGVVAGGGVGESTENSPDYGNWYIRINGKVLSDNKFKAIPFDSKESAKSRALELARKKNISLENIKLTKSWMDAPEQMSEAKKSKALAEKATSKQQQKFMGMVYAAKKGEKPASKEVAKVAKGISKKDAKDFAQTKHKGLPEKSKKDNK